MRKNKYVLSFVLFLVCILTLNTVSAVEIFDSKSTTEVYKLSQDTSSFNLPFFRVSDSRMELDKEISQIGMFFTNSSVDISAPLEKAQFIFSNDTVRINSDMEYAIVFCSSNVIVNANVENLIIFAGTSLTIDENGNVSDNLIAYTPKLVVNGNVDGNILGSASDVTINSVVNGQVRLSVDNISFGDEALVVSGISINTSNSSLSIPEEVGTSAIDVIVKENAKDSIKDYIVDIILAVIRDLVTFALILILIKKDKLQKMTEKLTPNKILKNGVLAYVISLGCIIFGFALAIYLLPQIGWAAFIFGIALMIIFTLVKNVVVGTFVANLTNKRYKDSAVKLNSFLVATTSFLMLELFETIPVLGTIIEFLIFIFAMGIVFTSLSGKNDDLNNVEKNEETTEVIDAK